MKNLLLLISFLCSFIGLQAQNNEWRYLSVDNTGIGGEIHEAITSDAYGNVWLGGYEFFYKRGSLVRFANGTFTNWGNYEGYLPDDRVHDIVFDKNNHVWVGTRAGVTHFDGKNWTNYNTANSALGADYVMGMAVNPVNNEIWVCSRPLTNPSEARLSVFNGTAWQSYSTANAGLPSNFITDVAVDQNGVKWIATNKGLVKFDGSTWFTYNQLNSGIGGPEVLKVKIDENNRVWCNSGNGSSIANFVEIFDGNTWQRITNLPLTNVHPEFFDVREDRQIVAEFGSFARVFIKDGSTWEVHQPKGQILDVHIDADLNYWLVGRGFVSKYNGVEWTHYTKNNTGLASYVQEDIFVDSKNRKWFANGNGGIQVFDCPKWEVYGPLNEGLFPTPQTASSIGTSITEDSNGDVWITYDATWGYAVNIPNGDVKNFAAWEVWDYQNVGFPQFASIKTSKANRKGKLAFINFSGNVFIYNRITNTWNYYNTQANGGPLHAAVSCIGTDTLGRFYFGGYRKISVYDNGTWSVIDLANTGSTQGSVNDINFDDAGNMWLACSDGVWKRSNNTWTHWNQVNDSIAGPNVKSIRFRNNKVYVAAYNTTSLPYGGGISIYDGQTWKSYLQKDVPLTHYQIDDLEFDTLGNLWIMSQEGVTIYKENGVLGFECIDEMRDTLQGAIRTTMSVHMSLKNAEAEIFPNPTRDVLNLKLSLENKSGVHVKIIDINGKILLTKNIQELIAGDYQMQLDLSPLEAGVYVCEIVTDSGRVVKKVVRQ